MTKVAHDLQKSSCASRFPLDRRISNALRSESFALLNSEFPDYAQDKLREGSRGEILRCAQNDTVGWSLRKVSESAVFRFSLLDQISDALPRKLQKRLLSTQPETHHAVRGELRAPLAVF